MSGVLDVVMSVLSGGATGLIGSLLTGWLDLKKQALMFNHEVKMVELEQETLQMEITGKVRIAEEEGEAARDVADAEALSTSHLADRATYSAGKAKESPWFVFVDVVRGLIRPGITLYLAAVVTIMYMDMQEVLNSVGISNLQNPSEILGLYREITLSIIYVTTTVILWWFGTRNKIGGKFAPK